MLAALASLLCASTEWMHRNTVFLTFKLESQKPGYGQVYWAIDSALSENARKGFRVRQGENWIRLSIPNMARQIRIDPLTNEGLFNISDIRLQRPNCISLFNYWCHLPLEINEVKGLYQIQLEAISARYHYRATGTDPSLLWAIRPLGPKFIPIVFQCGLFGLIVGAGMLGISLICERWRKREYSPNIAATGLILLVFPFTGLALNAIGGTDNMLIPERWIFFGSLALFGFTYVAGSFVRVTALTAIRIAVIGLALGLLLPDLAFRIGLTPRPLAGHEPTEYHWRIGRNYLDNVDHSALAYSKELAHLKLLLPAESVILTDATTSYYLSAVLNVFTRTSLPHHEVPGFTMNRDELGRLCAVLLVRGTPEHFADILERHGVTHVLINVDNINPNIRLLCKGISPLETRKLVRTQGEIIYSSKHFLLVQT